MNVNNILIVKLATNQLDRSRKYQKQLKSDCTLNQSVKCREAHFHVPLYNFMN